MPSVSLRSPHDRTIGKLAIPALGTLVAEPLYVLVDTAIVGRIGTTELAGLAVASTVILTLHSLLIFLAYGTTATVSRLIGAGDTAQAAHRSIQALWLSFGLGLASVALLAATGNALLGLFNTEADVFAAAQTYFFISLPGFPFLLLMMGAGGSFHGRQNTVTPLTLAVAGAVLNLVVELVLIVGLGYGLGASALSTVIAQVLTGTVAAFLVVRWARGLDTSTRPDLAVMLQLLRQGQALILRTAALRGSFTLSAFVAARIGTTELAAHQIALQIWGTLALSLDAVAIAGQALTGRFLGAGRKDEARGAARRMIEIDVAVGVLAGVIILLLRRPISELFTTDPAVASVAALVLVFVALQQPLNGLVFALDGVLIGAGDLTYLARTMVYAALLFAALASSVAVLGWGIGWLWASLIVFMAARGFFLHRRWQDDRWLVTGVA